MTLPLRKHNDAINNLMLIVAHVIVGSLAQDLEYRDS